MCSTRNALLNRRIVYDFFVLYGCTIKCLVVVVIIVVAAAVVIIVKETVLVLLENHLIVITRASTSY